MDVHRAKDELRQRIWKRLQEEGVDRFPGAEGRIPNFVGAEAAAERLAGRPAWERARHLKCNPDSPQTAVRKTALAAGKTVFMAVPRLRQSKPFIALDPDVLEVKPRQAASIKGAGRYGRPTAIEEMPRIDLIVAGSVAASPDGARLGKGGGYSDLEFALARAAGLVSEETVVATTVHPVQVVGPGTIRMTDHDVPLDLIVTPDEVIETERAFERPSGILWDELEPEKLESIPVLQALRTHRFGDQQDQ